MIQNRDSDIERAIKQRSVDVIVRMMFSEDDDSLPVVRHQGFMTETELWDFKASCPAPKKENTSLWADVARHVLAFHNNRSKWTEVV